MNSNKLAAMNVGLVSLLLITSVVIGGCSRAGDGPKQIVEKYSKSIFSGDYKKAYSYFSMSKKVTTSEDGFKKEVELCAGNSPLENKLNSNCRYEVVKESINGEKAIVKTDLVVPNMLKMGSLMINSLMSKDPKLSMEKGLEVFAKHEHIPTIKIGVSYDFSLVLESGTWKISEISKLNTVDSISPALNNIIKSNEIMAKDLMKYASDSGLMRGRTLLGSDNRNGVQKNTISKESTTNSEEKEESLLDEVRTNYGKISKGMNADDIQHRIPIEILAFRNEKRMGYRESFSQGAG